MWHTLLALALLLHGAGHAVGLWMPVPAWFRLAWLLPGVLFLVGTWGFWQRADWWVAVVIAAAAGSSLLLVLVPNALRPGPCGSAFVFDALAIVILLVPQGRRLITAL